MENFTVLLMGISGSGKTTLGKALANHLNAAFLDGDFLHPRSNIEKMSGGQSLDDADRSPWLDAVNQAVYAMQQTQKISLLACSALKKVYRDRIRAGNQNIFFLFLDIDYMEAYRRMEQRNLHFFQRDLLESQFEALERPRDDESKDTIIVDVSGSFNDNLSRCLEVLQGLAAGSFFITEAAQGYP